MKKEFPDHWEILIEKLANPYNFSIASMTSKNLLIIWKKKNSSVNLKYACPDDIETDRTNQIIKWLDIENGEELTRIYMKTDNNSLADVFEKFIKVSTEEYGKNPW